MALPRSCWFLGRGNITFPNSRLAQSSRPFLASRNLCPQHETAARQRNDGAITSELSVRKIMVIGGRVRNSQRSARPSHERIYRIEEDCWKGCNAYHSLYSQIMITNEDSPSQKPFNCPIYKALFLDACRLRNQAQLDTELCLGVDNRDRGRDGRPSLCGRAFSYAWSHCW